MGEMEWGKVEEGVNGANSLDLPATPVQLIVNGRVRHRELQEATEKERRCRWKRRKLKWDVHFR